MDMVKFTSAMLDAIAHCANEVQIVSDWRPVCAADMRDADREWDQHQQQQGLRDVPRADGKTFNHERDRERHLDYGTR